MYTLADIARDPNGGGGVEGPLMGDSMQPFDWGQFTGGVTGYQPGYASNTGITAGLPGTGGVQYQQGGGLQGQAAFDSFGRGLMATGGKTVDDLRAYVAQWNAQNPNARVTLGGSKGDKVYGPNGEFWNDAVISAGTGGTGFSWGAYGAGASGAPGAAAGGPQAPYNFATDDPSYQWRLQQGLEGVQKSAAANGTLLAGGTLKDLTAFGQGLASTEYQNAFGRKFDLASLGENAAAQTGNYGSQYGQNATGSLGDIGNANSAGSVAQGNIWGRYLNNLGG